MTKKELKKELSESWRTKGFQVFGTKCEGCGKPAVHGHHYVPRSKCVGLKYDLDNFVPLCFHCHFSRIHKGDPVIHRIIILKRGQKWYNRLFNKKETYSKKSSYETKRFLEDQYNNIINYSFNA